MYLVNFTDLATVPPFLASQADLARVLEAAEDVMATTPESDLDSVLDSWEFGLIYRALSRDQDLDDAWYCRALLTMCLRGLRGERAPKILAFGPGN